MADGGFYNADGELLCRSRGPTFVDRVRIIDIEPGEIAVIPRGVKIRVELKDGPARGYLCENYGGAFTLPERGPIGANCLANPRDFHTPVAAYEDRDALEDGRGSGAARSGGDGTIRRSMSSPGTAITHPTSTTCGVTRRWGRSCTIMRTHRSLPC